MSRKDNWIAGRYELLRCIGRGGSGEVWEASDALSRTKVALKLLDDDPEPSRVRREISALRMLRLPGVVRLYDEGHFEGAPFLVMDYVDGKPFPGIDLPCAWENIAERTQWMLEALARIHAAGIVHRDIKPANILVDERGRPTFLDFGICLGSPLGADPTDEDLVQGTPRYRAPELLSGEPVTQRTDLFAIGVVLYEALSARLPEGAEGYEALLRRQHGQRVPLSRVAPDAPEAVSRTIDALLEHLPEARPRSVAEVLRSLNGELRVTPSNLQLSSLPWLGERAPIDRAARAALSGQGLTIVGPPGSGRTRFLAEVKEVLQKEKCRALWVSPKPKGRSEVRSAKGQRRAAAVQRTARRLSTLLERGVVILCDDIEHLPRLLQLALELVKLRGAVLCSTSRPSSKKNAVLAEYFTLVPLTSADLVRLFAGIERILHQRQDAADALHLRTGGLPRRVREEVNAWVRADLAHWTDQGLSLRRDALDQLEELLPLGGPAIAARGDTPRAYLSPHLGELLGQIALLWPHATIDHLARIARIPQEEAFAGARALAKLSRIRFLTDGRIEPCWPALSLPDWPEARRRDLHSDIAKLLAPGADRRLMHLVRAAPSVGGGEIATEAAMVGRSLATKGRLSKALARLSDGLLGAESAGLSDGGSAPALTTLFAVWTEVALADHDLCSLDAVLYALSRIAERPRALLQMEGLLRAAVAFHHGAAEALEMSEAIPPFDNARLERRRHILRVLAARRHRTEIEERVVAESSAWALAQNEPEFSACADAFKARLLYRQGRFLDSASFQGRAAALEVWVASKIAAELNRASALLEAFAFEQATEAATAVRDAAARARTSYFEARAEWILRSIAFRQGASLAVDHVLLEATSHIAVPDLEGLVAMTEAGVAFHAGERTLARQLAERASDSFARVRDRWAPQLLRCLAVACGAPIARPSLQALFDSILSCPVRGVALQAIALLALSAPDIAHRHQPAFAAELEQIPSAHRSIRMDLLSADEASKLYAAASYESASGSVTS